MTNGKDLIPRKQFPCFDILPELADIEAFNVEMTDGTNVVIFAPSLEQFLFVVLRMMILDASLEDKIKGFSKHQDS